MGLSQLCVSALVLFTNLSQPANALPNPIKKSGDNDLPFSLSHFTSTVASVQNTYCGSTYNVPGVKFGDQTLVYALGDGDTVQRANIYHSKSLGIILAYQGTNLSSFVSSVHNVEAFQTLPDEDLGLPLGSAVFAGFQVAWAGSWDHVKQSLREAMQKYPEDKVIVTGHSQGAAIALLGALSIHHTFGDVIQEVIAYGVPRVGNAVFATAFDKAFEGKYTGVINGADWVPNLPPQFLNYRHPSGTVWINPANTTSWKFYDGQENSEVNTRKTEMFYPGTLRFNWGDHQGIYMHSLMGTVLGPCPARVGGY
ncbi:Alpha/Beta hydrolase protein [Ilyonectria sp. MPI-CAGE-AT-0026]|nr:Alpha/Beta hydrolase protein [Ilyonectria sp. MPI-CAGE-AT-0026]